ncbi:hypothetical protein AVEN_176274-1 [Araneus ventricosus]|uniref:Uncharacterized protein n=1 Tax=Araneus ventricosus TaxID=182803 RepID=A0A4Y2LS71_ARAVE|nr:hypothetical protein AVEN_176274-1 [Araneus ventricosus]
MRIGGRTGERVDELERFRSTTKEELGEDYGVSGLTGGVTLDDGQDTGEASLVSPTLLPLPPPNSSEKRDHELPRDLGMVKKIFPCCHEAYENTIGLPCLQVASISLCRQAKKREHFFRVFLMKLISFVEKDFQIHVWIVSLIAAYSFESE